MEGSLNVIIHSMISACLRNAMLACLSTQLQPATRFLPGPHRPKKP